MFDYISLLTESKFITLLELSIDCIAKRNFNHHALAVCDLDDNLAFNCVTNPLKNISAKPIWKDGTLHHNPLALQNPHLSSFFD
jgi:hypothetical protein